VNGTTPTTASAKYTDPITVSASETIKAFAAATGFQNSPVTSADFTIVGSPSALIAPANPVGATSATLKAIVNTLGLSGSYYFLWGTTSTTLTTKTATTALNASPAAVDVSARLTGLKGKTTYYYQAVVTTAGGTSTSAVASFTTQ
jgi:hypothetical protein